MIQPSATVQGMVLQHAALHAAGDQQQLIRLAGRRLAPGRLDRCRKRVVALQHEGRRLTIRLHVTLRSACAS